MQLVKNRRKEEAEKREKEGQRSPNNSKNNSNMSQLWTRYTVLFCMSECISIKVPHISFTFFKNVEGAINRHLRKNIYFPIVKDFLNQAGDSK